MNDKQRGQVRDSARYLAEVRPLDPEELRQYVSGEPAASAVKEVLREMAPNLKLIERQDGTFEPCPKGPIEPHFAGVDAIPKRHINHLQDLLANQMGEDWSEGQTGATLRETLRKLKEQYHDGVAVEYTHHQSLAYAIYHLPDYYAALQYVIDDLGRNELITHHLRVLDVGAGVGGPALGLADYLPEETLVEYHAIEPSESAAAVFEYLLEGTGRNFHPAIHRETAESFEPSRHYDLILFANVLSELSDARSVIRRYRKRLAQNGTLVLLAPADKRTSIELRKIERAQTPEMTVYSPTLRLWPDQSPTDTGWSFVSREELAVPAVQSRLDDGSGEFVNVDVKYSYALLRRDDQQRVDIQASATRHAKLGDAESHVGVRIDVLAVKLSNDLAAPDANPVYRVGDGSQSTDQFAVLARETVLNRDLLSASYGEVISIEGTLVLWNEDENGYNLVVDDETVVDRIG